MLQRPIPLRTFTLLLCTFGCYAAPLGAAKQPKAQVSHEKYEQPVDSQTWTIEMLPIPGGEFQLGSRLDEPGRGDDEGPQRSVSVDAFWMSKYEITWQQFRPFLDEGKTMIPEPGEKLPLDAITRPTPISWHINVLNIGMQDDKPVAGITQYAAKMYCAWLSEQSGHFYRLPTEAEWEYACRASSTTAYSFGDEANELAEYAWYKPNAYDVANEGYQEVGQKRPNAWGLHDMHGNVAEWVLDGYQADAYKKLSPHNKTNVYQQPTSLYPRVVRGGSWMDSAAKLRSAARRGSKSDWKQPDPANSRWYLRSGEFVGFRIIRPVAKPTKEDRERAWVDEFQD